MAWLFSFRHLRILATSLALAGMCAVPAQAGKNSAPAQVTMVATMPPTFSLQAAPATVTGASGVVKMQGVQRGRILISGQLRGQGGAAVVRIPMTLAANTRSFVVRAVTEEATSHATIYLEGEETMARRMPMRGSTALAMGMAQERGREFFALNRPLRSTLEIVIENLPSGQINNFRITLTMRDLGY